MSYIAHELYRAGRGETAQRLDGARRHPPQYETYRQPAPPALPASQPSYPGQPSAQQPASAPSYYDTY